LQVLLEMAESFPSTQEAYGSGSTKCVYQELRKIYCEKCITIPAKGAGHSHASTSGHDYAGSCCDVLGARANHRGTRLLRYLGSQHRKETLPKDSTTKSQTIIIDNKKSAIVFHYKTDGKKLTETYTPDGKKRVSLKMSSGQLTSSASWHDSVLVIESTLDIKVPNATVVVTGLKPVIDAWTLAADGRTLTHDADDHKEIYVYQKQ
jgi:hypothetical protein